MNKSHSKGRLTSLAKWLGVAALVVVSAQATAQIRNTRHNLGSDPSAGIADRNRTAGTEEICVFCHTPHGASTATDAPPLWNKRLTTAAGTAGYNYYNTTWSSTIDGKVLTAGSASIACLSCHDGSQAMDNIINAPGSGGFDSTGGGDNGQTGAAWNWTSKSGGTFVNTEGVLSTTNVANLGGDLRNDHPIGIQYCGGGPSVAAAGAACADVDFRAPASAVVGSTTVFWVNTNATGWDSVTPGTREKTDMILYNRDFTSAGAAGVFPSVECASCHDPHVSTQTFLRRQNTGSAVCLACHNK